MGWDLHFTNTMKIGEILADDEFNIEFFNDDYGNGAYIYAVDEEGDKSGICLPNITDRNYREEYLTYGYLSYGHKLRYFLSRLYKKYGILFADTCLDDWFYLQDDCKNEDEEKALWENCFANEIIGLIGKALSEDDEIFKVLEDTQPIRDIIYERYCERMDKTDTTSNENDDDGPSSPKDDDLPF